MFKEFYFKTSIPVKDTANPLSHHTLASLNFFNWMQALAPVKAKKKDSQLLMLKWTKLLRIIIEKCRYPTDLKDESYFHASKNLTIKKQENVYQLEYLIAEELQDGVILLLRPEIFSFFSSCLNLVIPATYKMQKPWTFFNDQRKISCLRAALLNVLYLFR